MSVTKQLTVHSSISTDTIIKLLKLIAVSYLHRKYPFEVPNLLGALDGVRISYILTV